MKEIVGERENERRGDEGGSGGKGMKGEIFREKIIRRDSIFRRSNYLAQLLADIQRSHGRKRLNKNPAAREEGLRPRG